MLQITIACRLLWANPGFPAACRPNYAFHTRTSRLPSLVTPLFCWAVQKYALLYEEIILTDAVVLESTVWPIATFSSFGVIVSSIGGLNRSIYQLNNSVISWVVNSPPILSSALPVGSFPFPILHSNSIQLFWFVFQMIFFQ